MTNAPIGIDARTFQKPLALLAETIAFKLQREVPKLIKPSYVATDLYVMVRQALKTYEIMFYLNADIRRQDGAWHIGFPTAALPLVRCMIDILYNVMALLENPGQNGELFRTSGYYQVLKAIEMDEKRYGGDPAWDEHIAKSRSLIDFDMRINGFSLAKVMASPEPWPTLGAYLRMEPKATPNKDFLRTFTHGFWKEYSAMAHATFNGLMPTASLFSPNDVPVIQRPLFEDSANRWLSANLLRLVGMLLSILSEIQCHFRFPDANINSRLLSGWSAVLAAIEIKELFDGHYEPKMKAAGII